MVLGQQNAGPAPVREEAATSTASAATELIVGRGTHLSGTLTGCDRLVVAGTASVTVPRIRVLEIAVSGHVTAGQLEVDKAAIRGSYEGALTVRKRLWV
jgi:hypothetical protein